MTCSPRRLTLALGVTVLLLLTGGPEPGTLHARQDDHGEQPIIMQPLELGLQEEAGVALLLLDVEVLDKEGRPLPGLTMADFQIFVDGKSYPLVAVDDFCACEAPAQIAGDSPAAASAEHAAAEGALPGNGPRPEPAMPPPPPPRFVLFFDFSQMQRSGREAAEKQARRWLSEAMRPDDEVLLTGYATAPGLREITPLTSDRSQLLADLTAAFADEAFMDPFPLRVHIRQRECEQCMIQCRRDAATALVPKLECQRSCCGVPATEESFHGKRSLEALDLLLTTLESVEGRKDLILFNQNGMMFPSRLYPQLDALERYEILDHEDRVKRISASATTARTALHVANLPEYGNLASTMSESARDLGTRFADYTGGTTNRAMADLPAMLASAGRRCCMYRLSIAPPPDPPNRAMRVRVMVRGRRLPGDYRIQFYPAHERWFRHARAALASPSRNRDPEIHLALAPTYLRDKRWVVEAQVAFALADLELVPTPSERVGLWRVGALLHNEKSDKTWEMFSMARATLEGLGSTQLEALHHRRIGSLPPGPYRLRLFVEDAQRNIFSAREAHLDLPDPEELSAENPWLHGPVITRHINKRLDLGLPFISSEPPIPTPVAPYAAGTVPVDGADVATGTALEFRSMLCPRPAVGKNPQVVSVLLDEGHPFVRLPATKFRAAGECVIIIDQVDTAALRPGTYTYRMMVQKAGSEPLTTQAQVTIQPPAGLGGTPKTSSTRPDMSTQKP
ncbi:MAG: hypothetical protein O7D35_08145 [Acidobacteria bacterium]|nr:hypothetical protein [Acidobacteriota bacterium]